MNKPLLMPEILAPAGSRDALTAAVRCGADAVYLGARQFSARSHAENFDDAALEDAAAFCHLHGVKLYLAINTLILEQEFHALDTLLQTAVRIGADGCIVQDLGAAAYMRTRVPDLPLHASTQMTVHSPAGVRFAAKAGFCRVVLARELSQKQMNACCAEAERCGMETEVFVHGAHCMCVSGQCWLSAAMGGRSANRGCCAQPCRLPFSAADGSDRAYALSLKDQSLLSHLHALCEMGVNSLKIEGRMKRPEYVAAAVSACKAALRGDQPDIGTLRAVFSRSGFTDGYFTGKRQEMFGIRQKEDVLAAQTVLQDLRAQYQKPRKVSALDAVFTLREGQPAELSVTDEDGNSVTVTGDVPQPAQNRPTDEEQLRRQFEKLGDTVYTAGKVTAQTDNSLMLPAAALNAMRRAAAEKMDLCRIRANTPQYTLGEIPAVPVCGKRVPSCVFRLQIRNLEQLSALDESCLPDMLLLPLHLTEDFAKSRFAQLLPQDRVCVLPPRFVCNETDLLRRLHEAHDAGFTRLACQSVGDAECGTKLGFTLHGTLGLHVTNTETALFLRDFGLTDALLSPEAAQAAKPAGVLPLGMFSYGKLPLMLMRNCPVQHAVGCAQCRHRLTDRKGAALYVDCTRYSDKPDYAELFNSIPVWLADKPESFAYSAYALLFMTDEAPQQVRDILLAYLRGEMAVPSTPFTRGIRLSDG